MTFTIDILLLALFALIVYNTTKRGFLSGVLGIAVWIAASFIAACLCEQLAVWLYDTVFAQRIVEELSQRMATDYDAQPIAEVASSVIKDLPESAVRAAQSLGIDTDKIIGSVSSLDVSADSIAAELAEKIVQPIATSALKALSFVVLLFVSSSLLKIVAHQIDRVAKIPVLKQANKALGAALGAIRGVVVVGIICVLLHIAAGVAGSEQLSQAVAESKLIAAVTDLGINL